MIESGMYNMDEVRELERLAAAKDLLGAIEYVEALPLELQGRWEIQDMLGGVCAVCGELEMAKQFYRAALKQCPSNPELLQNLLNVGRSLRKKLHTDTALPSGANRALMIAYFFPPLSGSGVFRSLKFAKYLPMFDWYPTVISAEKPPVYWSMKDESQEAEIPKDVEVIRISDRVDQRQLNCLNDKERKELLDFLRCVLCENDTAMGLIEALSQTPEGKEKLLCFPCWTLSWAYDVAQYIEKNLPLDQFQVIYTTSWPYSAHLVGLYLKQKYGIPWVADYRDMWTNNPFYPCDVTKLGDRLSIATEELLLHSADCNITIAKENIPIYVNQFRVDASKFAEITNGYDETDFSDICDRVWRAGKFTINYSGLLYSDHRSIAPVLRGIKELCEEKKMDKTQILFRFVGISTDSNLELVQRYGMEDIFQYVDYVSHKEALLANLNSDLLLLLVGDGSQLKTVYTGKVFEYLRCGRPILAIAPKDGVVDQLLKETKQGKAFLSTQILEIKQMILEEYIKWQNGIRRIQGFERKALTAKLAEIFEKVSLGSKK